jgi:hypothetical protein
MGTGNLGPKTQLVKNFSNFMTHSGVPRKCLKFVPYYKSKTIKIQLKSSAFSGPTGKSLAYSQSKKCSAYPQIVFGYQLLNARFRDHNITETAPSNSLLESQIAPTASQGSIQLRYSAVSQRLR